MSLPARLAARASAAVAAGAFQVVAVVLLVAGSVLAAVAPRLPVVVKVSVGPLVGPVSDPVFGVWPLLVVLALVPPVLVIMLLLVGQRAAALALTAATGAAAVGRLALDLSLLLAPSAAVRPELWISSGLDPVRAGPGALLLVGGQACLVVAALFAAVEIGRWRGEHGFVPGPDTGAGSAVPGADAGPASHGAARVRPSALPTAVGFAVLAGAGLLGMPFRSDDPALVTRSVLDAPVLMSLGYFGLAAALALAAGLAASSPDHRVAVGGLSGTSLAVLAAASPQLTVAALAPQLRVSPGPVLAVAGALGLAGLARSVSMRAWSAPRSPVGRAVSRTAVARWSRRLAALLCVVAGGCAVAAFFADSLRLSPELPQPRLPTEGLLLCTGSVLLVLGWFTAVGPTGRVVRPALGVVAMAMPMAAAEHIASVLAVLEVPGVDAGIGWWLSVLAVLAALAGALLGAVCGGFERDDVDLSERPFAGPTAPASAAAAVLAFPAFLLPLVDGAGRGVTGVFQEPFGLPAWALLGALAVTVGVALLGPRSRPIPAAVIYTGASVLLMLRLARILFGPRPLPSAGLAEGAWATLLCLVLLLAAATIAVRVGQSGAPGGVQRLSSAKPVSASTRRMTP